jgi:DNA-binding transcriptional ArsR family regulator
MRRDVFQAIADPTRREIITLIAAKTLTPAAVADNFDLSRQAISKHIKILIECGIIMIRQEKRERYCSIRAEKLDEVVDWLESFRKLWEGRFDKIDELLLKMKSNNDKHDK